MIEINNQILETIQLLPQPCIIAISGFGGSGKTSFAHTLGNAIEAPVVGVDSFQKDGAFDSYYKLWEIMDFARLEKEVLQPFLNKVPVIKYGHFDPKLKAISEIKELYNNGALIVEGVGLFRPELLKYFSYLIWIDCPLDDAIARGKKRDQKENHNAVDSWWDGIWKENDLQYFHEFKPKEKADIVISNT